MMTDQGKKPNPVRVAVLIAGFFLWSGILAARLIHLQIGQHEEYLQQAQLRQSMKNSISPPRGNIFDAHMDELATSMTVSTVEAEPRRVKDRAAAAQRLAGILNLDAADLLAKMNDPAHRSWMVVKRRIDPNDEALVEALDIDGIYLTEESMRVYPNLDLAGQVLGFVNAMGDGGAGIELLYDRELKGTEGLVWSDVDALRRPFRGRVEKPPVQGHSLVLSLDRWIQDIAERELSAGVERARAAAGIAIVMESDSGRILALANYPGFNCNTYNEYAPYFHRNRAVSDAFEPGSTFKVVVAAAALEAGLTRPDEQINCEMGAMRIAGHTFHDHKPYGLLTFREILEFSSNIGAAKLGMRLGERRLYDALLKFGFGARTGIDLPAEAVGLVRDVSRWSGLSVPAISFGQEVGVTSMQILDAINAIANGGYHVRPSLVDCIIDQQGDLVRSNKPEPTRIMSPETAAAVREAFEGVVLRGTGKQAALEGYRAAGKTGTAQKIVNGRYSDSRYVASFIGFAPLPHPRITVLVLIDEPRGMMYGGDVSAPVFSRIAQQTLLQLHVPPDPSLPSRLPKPNAAIVAETVDFVPNASSVAPAAFSPESNEVLNPDGTVVTRAAAATILLPDFTGMSLRTVIERGREAGIRIQAYGAGAAVSQEPAAGSRISIGEPCFVTFAAGGPGASAGAAAPKNQQASSRRRQHD